MYSHSAMVILGWTYILEKHGGKLPLKIKAVPEGTSVPTRNGNWLVGNSGLKEKEYANE